MSPLLCDCYPLTMLVFTRGERLKVCPVHANKAFLCVTIQSSLPSRCTMTIEVIADLVAIRAVYGVVDVTRW